MVNLTQTGLGPLIPGDHTPGNGPSPADNNASGPILAVHVSQGWGYIDSTAYGGSGPGWVFPASSASVISAAPGTGTRHRGKTWDQNPPAVGAVAASDIGLSITASGSSPRMIVLTGISFRVIRRLPALRGILVTEASGSPSGSGPSRSCPPATFQTGYVNLDTSPPTVTPAPNPGPVAPAVPERTAPVMFPYTISDSNLELFKLTISTQHCDCTWTAELYWTAGSKVGHTFIDDNGRPFETTAASAALPTVTWWLGNSGWSRG
jgi:hypothetical protein